MLELNLIPDKPSVDVQINRPVTNPCAELDFNVSFAPVWIIYSVAADTLHIGNLSPEVLGWRSNTTLHVARISVVPAHKVQSRTHQLLLTAGHLVGVFSRNKERQVHLVDIDSWINQAQEST